MCSSNSYTDATLAVPLSFPLWCDANSANCHFFRHFSQVEEQLYLRVFACTGWLETFVLFPRPAVLPMPTLKEPNLISPWPFQVQDKVWEQTDQFSPVPEQVMDAAIFLISQRPRNVTPKQRMLGHGPLKNPNVRCKEKFLPAQTQDLLRQHSGKRRPPSKDESPPWADSDTRSKIAAFNVDWKRQGPSRSAGSATAVRNTWWGIVCATTWAVKNRFQAVLLMLVHQYLLIVVHKSTNSCSRRKCVHPCCFHVYCFTQDTNTTPSPTVTGTQLASLTQTAHFTGVHFSHHLLANHTNYRASRGCLPQHVPNGHIHSAAERRSVVALFIKVAFYFATFLSQNK